MKSIDYPTATAGELARALRKKKISALELADAAIARIEAQDGPINAVVVRDFERARAAAKIADGLLAKGEEAPLLGVPMTVKESYDLEGWPTTWGFGRNKDHRADKDATVVARLKAAGAIILGKTNVPPSLADWQSDNEVYGRTNNPHDLNRSPGGSSGGGAAALAAGFVPLEMGSDIGGSIRIPATFCGVFGHKPSYAIVPFTGHSLAGAHIAPSELSVPGPMARCADDLALALDIVAGPDGEAAKGYRLKLPKPRHKKLADFNVLVIDSHPRAGTSRDIKAHLGDVAALLEGAGARVERESDLMPDLANAHGLYLKMLLTIITRRDPNGRAPISAHDWMDLLDAQLRLRREWAEFFGSFDAVIAPAFGAPAFLHNDRDTAWAERTILIDGESTPYGDQLAWQGIATVANLPATAMPLGRSSEGLPVGAQIIGAFLEDHTTIALAGLLRPR